MVRFCRIAFLVVCLWLAWSAWPLLDFYRLARAVEARNAVVLNERIDQPELVISLSDQVIDAYLKLTGRDRLGGASAMGVAKAVREALADPIVAKIMNPEVLLDLLQKGAFPDTLKIESTPLRGGLEGVNLRDVAGYYFSAEQTGRKYLLRVPLHVPPPERFGVRLRLIQWKWKLAGIDLPESLRMGLAKRLDELIKSKGLTTTP
jgi:hypothetical protein